MGIYRLKENLEPTKKEKSESIFSKKHWEIIPNFFRIRIKYSNP
jgi:hypothetical protein